MGCDDCGDTGVITVPAHSPSCSPLRCAGDCPRPSARACPKCEKASLGEDLS